MLTTLYKKILNLYDPWSTPLVDHKFQTSLVPDYPSRSESCAASRTLLSASFLKRKVFHDLDKIDPLFEILFLCKNFKK